MKHETFKFLGTSLSKMQNLDARKSRAELIQICRVSIIDGFAIIVNIGDQFV